RKVLIQPLPVNDLQSVKSSQQTVRGTIEVEWSKRFASLDLKVVLPAGVQGDISIPTLGLSNPEITEGGIPVWRSHAYVRGDRGLIDAKTGDDTVIFHAGSGSYDFMLTQEDQRVSSQ